MVDTNIELVYNINENRERNIYPIPNPSGITGPKPPASTLGDDNVLVLITDLFKNLYS